jgi:putative ABC transport system permease protein
MEQFTKDLRFAIRQLFRSRGFAITAILTLALAIGANTAIFTLFNQALLRALPVREPGQLVVLSFAGSAGGHTTSDGGDTPGHHYSFSYPMFRDLRERNTAFSGLVATGRAMAGVSWNDRAEQAPVELVGGNYFDVLGVQPALGRVLLPSDETAENANPVVVVSFDYWKNHLGQAPVTGKKILLNGYPFTIVGVAAPGFHSMVWGRVPSMYVPITMQRIVDPEWNYLSDHRSYWLNVVGRLRDGETREQALANIAPLWTALRTNEYPLQRENSENARTAFIAKSHLNLEAGAKGFSPYRDELRTPLLIMMGMMLLVISMAIVNVASLLLVRASMRVREFSMRYALGATNLQVLRQLTAEGLLLGICGALAGLALAPPALRSLIAWIAGRTSQPAFTPQLDWRVLTFTMGLALVASLLFSLAPALQFWNPRLADALRQQVGTGSGASVKFRRTCVALQVGLSLMLVIGAGVFMRTIQNLRSVNPGFATDHLLAFDLAPQEAGYPSSDIKAVEQRAIEALAALPGVKGVGATNDADLVGNGISGDVKVAGYQAKPDEDFDVELPWVSDNYHQTLGIPLIAGRFFAAGDTATSAKVAIVNETFARHYFKTPQDALGRIVSRPNLPDTSFVIVGVVADAKHASLRDAASATMYRPFVQGEKGVGLTFYVRTWQPPTTASASIRAAIANIDSKLIVNDLTTMTTQIDDTISSERTIAMLAAVFGSLATVLAGIGLYGILAYSIAQRTREFGIRMALGARRFSVVRLVMRETFLLAGAAIVVTIPLSILLTRTLRSQLYNVSTADFGIYAIGISVVASMVVLAATIPARRAASIEPATALRTE